MDDDDAVARLMQMVLEVFGYDTLRFDDPVACLEAWNGAARLADLLITDQTMPVMTGLELTETLRGRGCRMPVILSSGLGEVATYDEKALLGPMFILTKPFTAETLARTVREALSVVRPTPA